MFCGQLKTLSLSLALACVFFVTAPFCHAASDSFPTPAEVFQGRTFANESDRDIFFLRAIHDRYSAHWPELLEANVNEREYIQNPTKMFRFITELGIAMQDKDDPASINSLAQVTSDRRFFTNINAYHPEVLEATAQALMQLGPNARKALADSFSLTHYRDDSDSLEVMAKTIGTARMPDAALTKALTATAFDFSTTNGGVYPRCTKTMVQNLLLLPAGVAEVVPRLTTNNLFADPVRFQSVIDGIAAARATDLKTNLAALNADVNTKVIALKNYPGDYRDALEELQNRLNDAVETLGGAKQSTK